MDKSNFFSIPFITINQNEVLSKIFCFLEKEKRKTSFFHIVSLNPEIIISSQKNKDFKIALQQADIHLIDGIGIIISCFFLGIKCGARLTGVDTMSFILSTNKPLNILFFGGKKGTAERLADIYSKENKNLTCKGMFGFDNIYNHLNDFSMISEIKSFNPDIIFASFGSPYQELWFFNHKEKLKGIVCIGVGGAFDFLSGNVRRAPLHIRKLGLEWLYRLIKEPWRLKRQSKLIVFSYLVFKEFIKKMIFDK